MSTPAGGPTLEALRGTLVAIGRRASTLGFAPGVSGNLSVRVPGTPHIIIKATGVPLGEMTLADTLVIDEDGNKVDDATAGQPSTERWFHCAIYHERPEVGAIVHLHPPHCVAFAAAHALPPALTGAARALLEGKLVLIPPAPSGSRELARLVGGAFRLPAIQAAILAEHGTITVGPDLRAALHLSEYLEDAARTACLVRQIGGERR